MLQLKHCCLFFSIVTFFSIAGATDKKVTIGEEQQYLFHINKARLYAVDTFYQKACDEYEIAFTFRKDYVLDLFECAKVYDKLNNTANTLKYLKMSIEAGCNWYNDKTLLINLKRTNQFPLPSQIEGYRREYYQKLNMDYLLQLEKLVAIDQGIRNIGPSDYAQITDTKAEYKLIRYVDSANMDALKKLVEKYGYPQYSTVGYQGETDAFILLLHGLFDGVHDSLDWVYYKSIILSEVKSGRLMPNHYAQLYDRVVSDVGKKDLYYGVQYMPNNDGNLELPPVYDIANVDIRRKEIGLPPLGDQLKISHVKIPEGYYRK